MGIDLKKHHVRKTKRTEPASNNIYLDVLHSLYEYLARRTESRINKKIRDRLSHSRSIMQPVSISKLAIYHKEGNTMVVVGKITNDERLEIVPNMTVAALKYTRTAKARIQAAGGEALTLDQFAERNPTGAHSILLRGRIKCRKVYKHFGAVCSKTAPALPKTRSKGRKFEAKY